MKAYLKKYGVSEIVINVAAPSNKKSKAANQKEAKKNNTTTLNFLLDGLPNSIREILGEFTFSRELWLKLEGDYQGKLQGKKIEEEQEQGQDTHEHKGMNLVYHNFLFDKIDKAIVEYDIDLPIVRKDLEKLFSKATSSIDSYQYIHAKITHEDLKKLKKHIEASFRWYQKTQFVFIRQWFIYTRREEVGAVKLPLAIHLLSF